MKNLKLSLLAIALFISASVFLTSCGGSESEDPTPQKTDLELVKEGIVGNWQLATIAITKNGQTETFNGGCDESNLSDWAQANASDIDFNFTSASNVSESINCPTVTVVSSTYTVTENTGKFIIKTDNGFSFELVTTPDAIGGSTVKANIITPKNSGITSAVWTFTK